jgi:bla regulator protein blaR1
MLVEAAFWFHPLVWWIGARLVEERERACDEEVLRLGSEPRVYAEGILNVCKLYVESPLACVSGVTGSDLKKRIQAIMTERVAHDLNFAKKLTLAVAGTAALAVPIAVGIVNAPAIRAQSATAPTPKFEVASIRLSKNPEPGGNVEITPGRFRGKDLALQWLILVAYRINSGNLSGDLPSWTISERYDIDAKTDDASGEDRILLALQALLKDRFALKEHHEVKEEPVYFLTIGKNGIKMPPGSCVPTKKDLPNECYSQKSDGLVQTMDWRGVRISDPTGVAYRTLVGHLSINKRPVIDKTGLTGTFDVHLRWARDPEPEGFLPPGDTAALAPSAEPGAPSIFDAMEEQLGLKLESGRGPVEYLIVDGVERPGEN